MKKEDLIKECINQSTNYLEYIQEHLPNAGKVYDSPEEILYDEVEKTYELLLEKKIFDFEKVVFYESQKDIELIIDKDVFIKKYDEDNKSLKISINHKDINPELIKKDTFSVVSDLTFLIKNLLEWYDKKGEDLTFKAKSLNIKPDINILKNITPDKHQEDAIKSIFSSAYSYVWGPPGTGKTKVVLSNSIINYIYEGKKVLIVAPTNVALEQAMEGLIAHIDTLGLNRADLFRFGQATIRYLSLYPQTCLDIPTKKEVNLFSEDKEEISITKIMMSRLKKSKVVAMTLDTYIALSINLELEFDHIFCDEIGYASIIKTIPLFALKTPITYLGDHMQLPPVSEVVNNNVEIDMFSKSGIYIEHVIKTKFLARSTLITTHRFGQNLSLLLDQHIYNNGFNSKNTNQTELFYIDSKSNPQDAKSRTAINEINIIKELINNQFQDDFAILTPYNAQAFLLRKKLSFIHSSKVLTVHKSQGSEYDTVIFSIVDDALYGKRGIFFTDSTSQRSNGLNLINTVVSRTKKRLILVGNYDFWINQKAQLISGLFKLAKEYTV